jgi:hypothetical protein
MIKKAINVKKEQMRRDFYTRKREFKKDEKELAQLIKNSNEEKNMHSGSNHLTFAIVDQSQVDSRGGERQNLTQVHIDHLNQLLQKTKRENQTIS